MPLTELPFGLPGRVFRSPMPFGPYDPDGKAYDRFRKVLYMPIADFSVPTPEALEQAVQHTIAYAHAGQHIVIHCSAGIGRTGLFTAIMAKRCLGLSGAAALQWVRRYIPRAVETPEQHRLLLHDDVL